MRISQRAKVLIREANDVMIVSSLWEWTRRVRLLKYQIVQLLVFIEDFLPVLYTRDNDIDKVEALNGENKRLRNQIDRIERATQIPLVKTDFQEALMPLDAALLCFANQGGDEGDMRDVMMSAYDHLLAIKDVML